MKLYLAGVIILLISGLFFAGIFGTFVLGFLALLGALFGFQVSVWKVYLGTYLFFILVGKTEHKVSSVRRQAFSLFRGWHFER